MQVALLTLGGLSKAYSTMTIPQGRAPVDHTVGTRKRVPILPVVCLLVLPCVVYAQVCTTPTTTMRVPVSMRRMADLLDQARYSVGNHHPADP